MWYTHILLLNGLILSFYEIVQDFEATIVTIIDYFCL